MKKKSIFILFFLIFLQGMFSYSSNPSIKVKGYIKSYGNMPFVYPGIVTQDKKKYGIIADENIKKELLSSSGRLIEVEGYIIHDENDLFSLEDGSILIINWKKI